MAGDTASVLRELESKGSRPIVVASHPRSGTHLCIDLLRLNFEPCRSRKAWFERADRLYFSLDAFGRADQSFDAHLAKRILGRTARPIVKTHSLSDLSTGGLQRSPWRIRPELADWFRSNASIVYTYRDGREVLRSLYYFMQSFEPVARVPFSQFIRQEIRGMSRARVWAEHTRTWLAHPKALCLSMDQIRRDCAQTLDTIARSLDLPPLRHVPKVPSRCNSDIVSRAWRRILPEPGSTAIVAYRKNECFGHWRDAFSDPADREFFHREAGDLLIALGYEKSDRWVTAAASDLQVSKTDFPSEGEPLNAQTTRPSLRGNTPPSYSREQSGLVHA